MSATSVHNIKSNREADLIKINRETARRKLPFISCALAASLACASLYALRAAAQNAPPSPSSVQAASPAGNQRTPVLVELFTSEGCSSCPPADALLARLDQLQPVPGAEIIILEQHVDYWDGLGWHDPFSSAAATERQKEYAQALNADVYTPQMIVNGSHEFVGGDQRSALKTIESEEALPRTELQLSWAGDAAGDSRALHIHAGQLPGAMKGANVDVILAVTESHLHSDVRRGENAGRGLEHDGVVRQFVSIGHATKRGDASFDSRSAVKISKSWKRENLRAVVFLQDSRTHRVLASAEIPY